MYKVTTGELVRTVKLIDRADNALNNLERLNSNKILYPELKKELQELSLELRSRYDLEALDEWKKVI
jgi:hypothetical protein